MAFVTSTPAAGRFLLQFVHREMKIEPSLLTVAQLDADPEIDSWERHGEAQSSFAKYCIGPRRGGSFRHRINGARVRITTMEEMNVRYEVGAAPLFNLEDS